MKNSQSPRRYQFQEAQKTRHMLGRFIFIIITFVLLFQSKSIQSFALGDSTGTPFSIVATASITTPRPTTTALPTSTTTPAPTFTSTLTATSTPTFTPTFTATPTPTGILNTFNYQTIFLYVIIFILVTIIVVLAIKLSTKPTMLFLNPSDTNINDAEKQYQPSYHPSIAQDEIPAVEDIELSKEQKEAFKILKELYDLESKSRNLNFVPIGNLTSLLRKLYPEKNIDLEEVALKIANTKSGLLKIQQARHDAYLVKVLKDL